MKSFRAERQSKSASSQVILTLLVLLMSIMLVRFLPGDIKEGKAENQKSTWESSVVKLP